MRTGLGDVAGSNQAQGTGNEIRAHHDEVDRVCRQVLYQTARLGLVAEASESEAEELEDYLLYLTEHQQTESYRPQSLALLGLIVDELGTHPTVQQCAPNHGIRAAVADCARLRARYGTLRDGPA